MNHDRRDFLKKLAAAATTGLARRLGIGVSTATVATAAGVTAAQATAVGAAAGSYGSGVRAQVFEVIVRQGMAGAPWETICAGPMAVNNIDPEDVRKEMARRKIHGVVHNPKATICFCTECSSKRGQAQREYQARLDAIPHSEMAPCACKACRRAVDEVLAAIHRETRDS